MGKLKFVATLAILLGLLALNASPLARADEASPLGYEGKPGKHNKYDAYKHRGADEYDDGHGSYRYKEHEEDYSGPHREEHHYGHDSDAYDKHGAKHHDWYHRNKEPWVKPPHYGDYGHDAQCNQTAPVRMCPNYAQGQGPTASSRPRPAQKGVFEEMDATELAAVRDFLLAQSELNLTPNDEAAANSSIIFLIELKPPVKIDALAHLDHQATAPVRKALATLFLLNQANPVVLMVEVDNTANPTSYVEHKPPKYKNPINIHDRPTSSPEYDRLEELMVEASATLDGFMKDQLGGYHYNDCTDKCLFWGDSAPRGIVDSTRGMWIFMTRYLPGLYLHPVGLDFYVIAAGNDPSQWRISKVWWAKKLYDSPQELADAWESGADFSCCPVRTPTEEEAKYSSFDVDLTDPRPRDKRPGAQLFEPYGKRFTITGNTVEYMGWQASVGVSSSVGLRMFDVRFKGERIVYELSLQQAAAVYGGASPFQAFTAYQDTAWGMGASHLEVVHGVDCPLTASYMDMYHLYDSGTPSRMKNSVCIFELDPAFPLRRHLDRGFPDGYFFYGGVRSHALVIRVGSTVYNYDYFYDVLLYLDGTVETKIIPFGYPQTEHRDADADFTYGHPMFYDVGGTIHAHSWHWKVDLDVVGPANSFLITDIQSTEVDISEWHPAETSNYKYTTVRNIAATEDQAQIKLNPDHPKYFTVINTEQTNKWGAPRGYRLEPMGTINQIFPDDWRQMPAYSWTKHHVVTTLRKEDEQVSCTIFEQSTPASPVLNFADYIDGDNIEQKDLVVWLTLAGYHIPLSEDAPNTPSTAHHTGFALRPYNYFDVDAAKDLLETRLLSLLQHIQ